MGETEQKTHSLENRVIGISKSDFRERWNKALAYGDDLLKTLFYKKPLIVGELRADIYDRQRKEVNKRYCKTEKFKIVQKRYQQSEKGKATRKRYKQSEKGKVSQKKYKLKRKLKRKLEIILKRAEEEFERITQEERRAFDEWERQNKKHTVY